MIFINLLAYLQHITMSIYHTFKTKNYKLLVIRAFKQSQFSCDIKLYDILAQKRQAA